MLTTSIFTGTPQADGGILLNWQFVSDVALRALYLSRRVNGGQWWTIDPPYLPDGSGGYLIGFPPNNTFSMSASWEDQSTFGDPTKPAAGDTVDYEFNVQDTSLNTTDVPLSLTLTSTGAVVKSQSISTVKHGKKH